MENENGQWHHIINTRRLHECTPEHKEFRHRRMGLVAYMGATEHRALHRDLPAVPVLDIFSIQRLLRVYEPTPDTMQNMDNYMRSIEQVMMSPKSHSIERQVASLAIHAVDLQRPYVREGLLVPPERHLRVVR